MDLKISSGRQVSLLKEIYIENSASKSLLVDSPERMLNFTHLSSSKIRISYLNTNFINTFLISQVSIRKEESWL